MRVRPYIATDAGWLLAIFRKNVPVAFGADEIAEYANFLRTNTDPYFVAEHNGEVIGACGHYFVQDGQIGRICWIFSDPDRKGLGVGGALLKHNLDQIRQHTTVQIVECRTSQVAYRFFEKFGFVLQYTELNYWAPGLDLYFMKLDPKTGRV